MSKYLMLYSVTHPDKSITFDWAWGVDEFMLHMILKAIKDSYSDCKVKVHQAYKIDKCDQLDVKALNAD